MKSYGKILKGSLHNEPSKDHDQNKQSASEYCYFRQPVAANKSPGPWSNGVSENWQPNPYSLQLFRSSEKKQDEKTIFTNSFILIEFQTKIHLCFVITRIRFRTIIHKQKTRLGTNIWPAKIIAESPSESARIACVWAGVSRAGFRRVHHSQIENVTGKYCAKIAKSPSESGRLA